MMPQSTGGNRGLYLQRMNEKQRMGIIAASLPSRCSSLTSYVPPNHFAKSPFVYFVPSAQRVVKKN